jgi:beta-lactamase class A
MTKKIILSLFIFSAVFCYGQASSINDLKESILKVIEGKSATVAVFIKGTDLKDNLSINGDKRLPMQSVYKLHLAAAVLHNVDEGKLSLHDSVKITPELISEYQSLWSPLRNKYPDGITIKLEELIKYTVAWSDNLGCDLLFDQIGGPDAVQKYMREIGLNDVAIADKEIVMQSEWSVQYRNWATTNSCNKLLQILYENNDLLSDSSYEFLFTTLKGTTTGKGKIRGQLPEETIVAHKTGYSGKNDDGIIAASNDIGIVFLPDGSYFYISIFVSDSREEEKVNQEMIANISKLAWDYFLTK